MLTKRIICREILKVDGNRMTKSDNPLDESTKNGESIDVSASEKSRISAISVLVTFF